MKKWLIGGLVFALIAALYVIELGKVQTESGDTTLNLDELEISESDRQWDPFYRVRARLIDGQTASFTIPNELRRLEGKEIQLTGAALFFSNGCYAAGDKIAVKSMFLLPTLGLANACVHLPEVAMRWTIIVTMENDWLITHNDMIQTMVRVKGTFRINKEKPYDAVFFIDRAVAELIEEEGF